MRPTTRIVAALVAALLLALAPAGASAAGKTKRPAPWPCGIKGATAVSTSGSRAIVTRTTGGDDDDLYAAPHTTAWGCLGKRKAVPLGDTYGSAIYALRGDYAAFGEYAYDSACTKYSGTGDPACVSTRTIALYNLRTGKQAFITKPAADPFALYLGPHGTLAWVMGYPNGGGTPTGETLQLLPAGATTAKQVGSGHIALDTVTFTASGTLEWFLLDGPFSAPVA